MTYPTPEEINQIAEECGLCDSVPVLYTEELQAFFLRGIEMGRKMQRESDEAAVANVAVLVTGNHGYTALKVQEMCMEAIRNNTGE